MTDEEKHRALLLFKQKNETIRLQDAVIKEKDDRIRQLNNHVSEQSVTIAKHQSTITHLEHQNQFLTEELLKAREKENG